MRIDLVNEGAIFGGEVDSDVVRCGGDPDVLTLPGLRPPPDAEVVALGEGVVLLLIVEVGCAAVEQEHGHRGLIVASHFGDGLKCFEG